MQATGEVVRGAVHNEIVCGIVKKSLVFPQKITVFMCYCPPHPVPTIIVRIKYFCNYLLSNDVKTFEMFEFFSSRFRFISFSFYESDELFVLLPFHIGKKSLHLSISSFFL